LKLLYLEDDFFEDFRNALNYECQKGPPIPITPLEPLDKGFLRKSMKELTSILSNKWTEEVEHCYEEIQIHVPASTIQCNI
jgi:hypothetical protein